MILVDTSVWISYLGPRSSPRAEQLDALLQRNVPVGLSSVIYQELLQGTADQASFDTLKGYLDTQRFYHPKDLVSSYASAAELYARCRRAGITPRSTIDCLIAQIAIEHELWLLHDDKDFVRMAGVVSELRLFEASTV